MGNSYFKLRLSIIIFSIFYIATIGCEKNDSASPQLEGQWIRLNVKTDTLTFKQLGDNFYFDLRRGYDTIDDQIISKTPSGLFEYKIYGDSIWIQWTASSFMSNKKFYFKNHGSTFEIGDFIDRTNTIMTFRLIGQ